MVIRTDAGLYVPEADLYIDPLRPVHRAVVTHGHADHARRGSEHYLAAASGVGILRKRLGDEARIEAIAFGERRRLGGATLSLHPAGHILGSAQVRIEVGGEVWLVTGDYKRTPDASAEPFESLRCHTLISECTFGLPVYRWPEPDGVFREIERWWVENAAEGRTTLLCGYSLGKAQRLLAGLLPFMEGGGAPGTILVHGAVDELLPAYRAEGIAFPPTERVSVETAREHRGAALVVAPPSAAGTAWVRKLGPVSVGFASGWMRIRGRRRRRSGDRGFVLSDHVDWDGLMATIDESGAERVGLTHGQTGTAMRYLTEERGLDTFAIATREGDA